MKLLVTGGAGFIGSHVADGALAAGHEVTVLDNLTSGKRVNVPQGAQLVELDMGSAEAAQHIASGGYQVVFHLAAQIDVRVSVARPQHDAHVNICGLINVVEAARQGGRLEHVIFSSSGGAIYGEQDSFPAAEDHPTRPESPYGVAKLCGEHYLEWFDRAYGISHTALRYSNVFGPRQDPFGEAGVVAIFCNKLLAGEAVTIYGDGGQTRDFVFVSDVARANLLALEKKCKGAINIGTGKETSVNEVYGLLAEAKSGERPLPPVYRPGKPGEQRRSVIDPSRCQRVLGFTPDADLAAGLRETLEYFGNLVDRD